MAKPRIEQLAQSEATDGQALMWSDALGSWGSATVPPPASGVVSSEVETATTSITYVLAAGMTITPIAGTYVVLFSADVDNSTKGVHTNVAIYSGGTYAPGSERSYTAGGSGYYGNFTSSARVTVNGAQAIEGRFRTDSNAVSLYARNLIIIRVS